VRGSAASQRKVNCGSSSRSRGRLRKAGLGPQKLISDPQLKPPARAIRGRNRAGPSVAVSSGCSNFERDGPGVLEVAGEVDDGHADARVRTRACSDCVGSRRLLPEGRTRSDRVWRFPNLPLRTVSQQCP